MSTQNNPETENTDNGEGSRIIPIKYFFIVVIPQGGAHCFRICESLFTPHGGTHCFKICESHWLILSNFKMNQTMGEVMKEQKKVWDKGDYGKIKKVEKVKK